MAERNAREEAERATTAEERTAYTLELLGRCSPCPRRRSGWSPSTSPTRKERHRGLHGGLQRTRPLKSAYRRFRIQGLEGHPDDYASMQEVLRRRPPGGRRTGTRSSCPCRTCSSSTAERPTPVRPWPWAREFGVEVPIFGMVKDDRHRTRALVTPEGREIGIVTQQAVFSLIGQIQEETHRFAITYHHESHSKSATRSALDGIPGVGEKRREDLRKHFGTIKAIREADVDTLAAVVPRSAAQAVWEHFHRSEGKTNRG